jgi:putative DNA primase/helicase
MRDKFPRARIVILADLGNGEDKATEAAMATADAVIAKPDFGAERPEGAKDFNDLYRLHGAEAVRKAVEAAQRPDTTDAQLAPENRSEGDSVSSVSAPSGNTSGEWPEPQPLPDGLPAVKAFEPDLLPDSLRPWVMDICDRLQCPADFVAVAVMVSLGSVIGRRIGIRPQEKTDWIEFPNLWGCIVGRPSVMKSPALEQGLAPLKRLAAKAAEAHEVAMMEFEAKSRIAKLRREAADAEIKKRLKGNALADVRDLQGDELEDEPHMRRYLTNDTSYESLGDILKTNPNGLLVYRDELVSLLKTLDREDNAGARGFYLTGWSGNSPYVFDRMTRQGASLDAICISMLGSTQPGRIADYIRAAVKGGSGDDGLMQRFGLLVWPDTSPQWRDVDRWPDSEASRAAFALFDRMSELDPLAIGAQQDENRDTGETYGQPYLRLDAEALEIFREWREGWEGRFRSGSEIPALESHFTKYRKLVPALALICHLADTSGQVGRVAILRALAWAEYLETHARRAYASLDAPEQSAAKAIIDRLRKGDLAPEFKARDIYRKGWAHLSDRELVHNALDLLADFDWLAVRDLSARETEGRPARVYVANPRGLRL